MKARLHYFAITVFYIFACTFRTEAANQYWDFSTAPGYLHGSGYWSDTKWSVNGTTVGVWTNGNRAFFSAVAGSSVITLNTKVTSAGFSFFGNAYSLIITNGGGLSNATTAISMSSGTNRIEIIGGAVSSYLSNSAALNIGLTNGMNTFIINGAGTAGSALLTNGGIITVGNAAKSDNNRLIVTNGGVLITTAATPGVGNLCASNSVELTGGGSLWNLGGQVVTIGKGGVGAFANRLLIDGQGTAGGAILTNGGIVVGATAGSTLNSLVITNGGSVFTVTSGSTIGNLTSTNTALVTGANSLWDHGGSNLIVGSSGYIGSTLTMDKGATMRNLGVLRVYPTNDVFLLGGTLSVSNIDSTKRTLLLVGDSAQSFALNLTGGTVTNDAGIWINSNATVSGNGRLTAGNADVVFTNGSTLMPGATNTIGTITLVKPTLQGGMTLDLNVTNVTGAAGSSWDNIRVLGTLNAAPGGGKIKIKVSSLGETNGGFDPNISRVVNLIDFSSTAPVVSSFEVDTNNFLIGSNWTLEVTASDVRLTYVRPSPVIFVSPAGNNSAGTNWTTAYTTVSNAMNYVQSYDTVYLAGTNFDLTTNVVLSAKYGVSILGGYQASLGNPSLPGPNDPSAWPTTLQRPAAATTTNRIMYLSGLTNSLVKNLIIRNGYLYQNISGAGLYLTQCRDLTLDSCTVISNVVSGTSVIRGAGLYAVSSVVIITNTAIVYNSLKGSANSTAYGGGLYLDAGTATVTRCQVIGNYSRAEGSGADTYAGGVFLNTGCVGVFRQSVISRNTAAVSIGSYSTSTWGGGILNAGQLYMENCLIDHNVDESLSSGGLLNSYALTLVNCTVAHNGSGVGIRNSGSVGMTNTIVLGHSIDLFGFPNDGAYVPIVSNVYNCCIGDGDNVGVQGCISIDPLFVDTNYYHLQSKHGVYTNGYFTGGAWGVSLSNSPCIDTGSSASDFSLEPAPNGGLINMGAYGNTAVASLSDTTTLYSKPAVTNTGAFLVGHSTVRLIAQITDAGAQAPWCGFAYWIGAGPTSTVSAGIKDGRYESVVGGLTPGSSYQFAAFASNSAGSAWSETKTFGTHPVPDVFFGATNGNNTTGANWSSAYSDLAGALDILETGDTLYLAGQTFALTPAFLQESLWTWAGLSDVNISGGYAATSDAVLPGNQNPDLWPTVLTRSSGGSRILLVSGLTNCALRNVTIYNGATAGTAFNGLGIYAKACTGFTVDSCTIISNSSPEITSGGGLYVESGLITITNSLIVSNAVNPSGNNAQKGGGLYLNAGTTTVTRSRIVGNICRGGNSGSSQGGGVFVASGAVGVFRQSVVSRNTTVKPPTSSNCHGGAFFNNGRVSLENCLIDNNSESLHVSDGIYSSNNLTVVNSTVVDNGGGIGTGVRYLAGTVGMTNTIVWGHADDVTNFPSDRAATPTLSNVYNCCIGNADNVNVQGCISNNPLFVDSTYYHLQSRKGQYVNGYFSGGSWGVGSRQSPCIDTGDLSPYDNEPSPNGGKINMGAYGNTEVASMTWKASSGSLILIR